MAAMTKKITASGAKALREMGIEEIDKSIKSPDAASCWPSQPKINANLINEDEMTNEEEMAAIMKLEEVSLHKFLEDDPDIYTLEDLKVRYK